METDYLGKRFRILPARPFQFAPRNSVSITRYGNNIYKGVIDWSLNACCKLKLVFWKSIFKITLHMLPCFSFCFFQQYFEMERVYNYQKESFPCMHSHKLGEQTGQVWRDNSHCVCCLIHFFVPNQEPAFAWPFGNGLVRVNTQGVFCPCSPMLKTFHHTFSPNPTDFPWVPEDAKTFDSTPNR